MMIDCGGGDNNWPSKLLSHYNITRKAKPIPVQVNEKKYALDNLVISHPHGDHLSDIENIRKKIGFYSLTGGGIDFIDQIENERIDFRKREKKAGDYFKDVAKEYTGQYIKEKDRIITDNPCIVKRERFLSFNSEIDLNDISYLVSLEFGNEKILFTGDLTAKGVIDILESDKADKFTEFVRGTTILKVPHHGREDGCSEKMFEACGAKPKLCVISDEILNEKNEGTSNTDWYKERTYGVTIDGNSRMVLTTRKDKDIYVVVNDAGQMQISVNCFADTKEAILNS